MKTGFTDPAGSCLIATAQKDDMQYLAVVLNAPPPENNTVYRDIDSITLFEYGFANYNEITKIEEPVITFETNGTVSVIPLSSLLRIGIFLLAFCLFYFIIKCTRKSHSK